MVTFTFPPRGWAFCEGQALDVGQNEGLWNVIGYSFGGNGTTTFALPDLRNRVPIGTGQGPGLTARTVGEQGGTATVALDITTIPAHSHGAATNASSAPATTRSPEGAIPAMESGNVTFPYNTAAPDTTIGTGVSSGGGLAHANLQPYIKMTYIIALEGTFPARDD